MLYYKFFIICIYNPINIVINILTLLHLLMKIIKSKIKKHSCIITIYLFFFTKIRFKKSKIFFKYKNFYISKIIIFFHMNFNFFSKISSIKKYIFITTNFFRFRIYYIRICCMTT